VCRARHVGRGDEIIWVETYLRPISGRTSAAGRRKGRKRLLHSSGAAA